MNVTNGPSIAGGEAAAADYLPALNGKRQEIKIRSDNAGNPGYPLYETLRRFKEGDPKTHLAANSQFKVIIRADENTEYQFLQPVLAECSRAGVSYNFATLKGRDARRSQQYDTEYMTRKFSHSPPMKIPGTKRIHYDSGPNMTPLVDIVMVIA